MGIGFIAAHPGAGKEMDGHGIDDADAQTALMQETSYGEAVSTGGLQANAGWSGKACQPTCQGLKSLGRVSEGGLVRGGGEEQCDIELEFGYIDAKLGGVGIHSVLRAADVPGTILVHTACGLRQRWPQLRYSPVLGRLFMGAEADLLFRIPILENKSVSPLPPDL